MQTTTINGTEYKLLASHGDRELVQHPTSGDVVVHDSARNEWSVGLAKADVESLIEEPSALIDVYPMAALAPDTYARVTITTESGAEITAEVTGRDVVISQDGHEAGRGTLRRFSGLGKPWVAIDDCPARLGHTDGSETEAAYEALDAALTKALQ